MALTVEQQHWFEQACRQLSAGSLAQLTKALVDVASPTGEEGPLARMIVERLLASGVDGYELALDEQQSNAFGLLIGKGGGESLLLYSPIDTVTSGNAAEDLPWAASEMLPHMRAHGEVAEGLVSGLGAHNPKGHAACIIAAAQALKAAGVPLKGDLYLGFGAGGMPTNARTGTRADSGHGVGCARLLAKIPRPDYAVIAKSGWSVSWEEVGLAWYEVQVFGTHTYVGSRHLMPYENAIVQAGRVIEHLERWFEDWAEQHRSGLVAPQGVVSFIEAGWERMPAFTPQMCRFRFDLRLSPRVTAEEADRALAAELAAISTALNVRLKWQRLISIPGTTTPRTNPIIQRCIEAWEAIEGRAHKATSGLSGATDANILRGLLIPTARIGLPKVPAVSQDFARGMNTVAIDDLLKLTKHLIHTAIAVTC